MFNFIKELYQNRYLIKELIVRDIKRKYRRSILGVLWSLLNPLLKMIVTAMIFSNLFRFDISNYIYCAVKLFLLFTMKAPVLQ